MSEVAIRAEGLGKRYRIGRLQRYRTLRDTVTDAWRAPARWVSGGGRSDDGDTVIWALRDVSFEIAPGEVVGVIGRNGAGKSTLLKIMSRITEPTTGRAEIHGRVGSLLEVGTGFHPELTGRENVYLNGAILGMRRREIEARFDDIVAFAEVEQFIDTPVKYYSSGMYLRLAFAVAAHLEPEILLVDEVLAVGDIAFQRKCLGKISEVARRGRTALFVSHNMDAIARLCERTLWLETGRVVLSGPSVDVIRRYQSTYLVAAPTWSRAADAASGGSFAFLSVTARRVSDEAASVFGGDEPIRIEIRYRVSRALTACQVGARVHNADGLVIFTTSDADATGMSALTKHPGEYATVFDIPAHVLVPGTYHVLVAAHAPKREVYDSIDRAVTFEIAQTGSLASVDGRLGVTAPVIPWRTSEVSAP
jgi:lipopolysaccharide transport system ATP-binding protein